MAYFKKLDVSYNELKKIVKKNKSEDRDRYKLAIVGDSSTQFLSTAISGYAIITEIPLSVLDTDYNQITAQLWDLNSEVFLYKPNMFLLYMSSEYLWQEFAKLKTQEEQIVFAQKKIQYIRSCWNRFNVVLPQSYILQTNFVNMPDSAFGNNSAKIQCSFTYQLRKLNYLLQEAAESIPNVLLLDLDMIQSLYGRSVTVDNKMVMIAKAMLSQEILPEVAKNIVDIIQSVRGRFKKCIVLDLDNTLWGGVIGDDGIEGIQIGELGSGSAFMYFQMWLKELKDRGILLTVCSKNNEEIAKEPFRSHPDMILKLDDFSMFVANWEDKATNIRNIQKTLNIGMDSIVFIDDNPFERNAVRSQLPDICVPELPQDPAEYLSYLQSLNLFEISGFSAEDRQRTKQYQEESIRLSTQAEFKDYDRYLESLSMVATSAAFDKFHRPRISQLTNRSNQFNLRTIRYSEAEIEALSQEKGTFTRWYELKDKFGDYGLIGVLIMKTMSDETLFIDTLLMSCRVLKRGMEQYIFDTIADICRENGFKRVIGEYLPTAKNGMVKDLYIDMGYKDIGAGRFQMDLDDYKKHITFIKGDQL